MSRGAEIRVDANTRGAEAGLNRVRRGYQGITQEAQRAARSASRAPGAGAGAGPGAPARPRQIAGVGSAIGGRAGGALGRVAGGMAALGPIGIAASVAAIALRSVAAASDRAAQAAQRVYERSASLSDALRDAAHSAQDQAAATLESSRAALRELAARTGARGEATAQALTSSGMRDVEEGLLAIVRASGDLDPRAIAAATTAARTGLMEFGEAAKQAAGRRLTGDAQADAARLLQGHTGRAMTAQTVSAMTARLAATRVGQVTERTDAMRGQVTAIQIDRALSGAAHVSAARQLHETTDPVARAREREARAALRQQEAMNAAADAAWGFVEVMSDVGMIFGGEGSRARQAARFAGETRSVGLGN